MEKCKESESDLGFLSMKPVFGLRSLVRGKQQATGRVVEVGTFADRSLQVCIPEAKSSAWKMSPFFV